MSSAGVLWFALVVFVISSLGAVAAWFVVVLTDSGTFFAVALLSGASIHLSVGTSGYASVLVHALFVLVKVLVFAAVATAYFQYFRAGVLSFVRTDAEFSFVLKNGSGVTFLAFLDWSASSGLVKILANGTEASWHFFSAINDSSTSWVAHVRNTTRIVVHIGRTYSALRIRNAFSSFVDVSFLKAYKQCNVLYQY